MLNFTGKCLMVVRIHVLQCYGEGVCPYSQGNGHHLTCENTVYIVKLQYSIVVHVVY